MIIRALILVTILEFRFGYGTSIETFDRELQYCCPMSTDTVSLLVNEYFCVGVYNERRVLNIDCDGEKNIKIVEFRNFNITNTNLKRFCFVTEEDADVEFLAVCMQNHSTQWFLDVPYCCKLLSIIYLFMTLYGYARIETLRRPEDIPFIIFTGFLMMSMMTDVGQVFLERHSKIEMIFIYIEYYTKLGSFIWMNIILLYQLRENM